MNGIHVKHVLLRNYTPRHHNAFIHKFDFNKSKPVVRQQSLLNAFDSGFTQSLNNKS